MRSRYVSQRSGYKIKKREVGEKEYNKIIYGRDKISEELKSDNLLKKQVNDIKNLIHRN